MGKTTQPSDSLIKAPSIPFEVSSTNPNFRGTIVTVFLPEDVDYSSIDLGRIPLSAGRIARDSSESLLLSGNSGSSADFVIAGIL